jgi:hypothetical protein
MKTDYFGTFLDVISGNDAKSLLVADLKTAFEAALKVSDEETRNILMKALNSATENLQKLKLA